VCPARACASRWSGPSVLCVLVVVGEEGESSLLAEEKKRWENKKLKQSKNFSARTLEEFSIERNDVFLEKKSRQSEKVRHQK